MTQELNIAQFKPAPIMGERLTADNSLQLDFTANNHLLNKVDLSDTSAFNKFVFDQIGAHRYGYGGYLENRVIYKRSGHFQTGDARCIHLGVDIWCEAFHPVYAPFDSIVHSFKNNDNFGDYGPTIILVHQIENKEFYTLYGHLSLKSLEGLQEGQKIKKGEAFCELGPYPENGDWPPHLHFQYIQDMEDKKGDFPGVCAPSALAHYQKTCLDPSPFL